MENGQHPPPAAHKFKFGFKIAFWCSCQICVNKLFRVHCTCTTRYHQSVHVEGMPITGWWGWEWGWGGQGCIAPPKFPNLQKSPTNCCFARQASLKNWKFYIFLVRKIDQISGKGPLLSDLHPLRPKNSRIFGEMPTSINSGWDPLLKNLHPPQ